jgi:hypothetical protein
MSNPQWLHSLVEVVFLNDDNRPQVRPLSTQRLVEGAIPFENRGKPWTSRHCRFQLLKDVELLGGQL